MDDFELDESRKSAKDTGSVNKAEELKETSPNSWPQLLWYLYMGAPEIWGGESDKLKAIKKRRHWLLLIVFAVISLPIALSSWAEIVSGTTPPLQYYLLILTLFAIHCVAVALMARFRFHPPRFYSIVGLLMLLVIVPLLFFSHWHLQGNTGPVPLNENLFNRYDSGMKLSILERVLVWIAYQKRYYSPVLNYGIDRSRAVALGYVTPAAIIIAYFTTLMVLRRR